MKRSLKEKFQSCHIKNHDIQGVWIFRQILKEMKLLEVLLKCSIAGCFLLRISTFKLICLAAPVFSYSFNTHDCNGFEKCDCNEENTIKNLMQSK